MASLLGIALLTTRQSKLRVAFRASSIRAVAREVFPGKFEELRAGNAAETQSPYPGVQILTHCKSHFEDRWGI